MNKYNLDFKASIQSVGDTLDIIKENIITMVYDVNKLVGLREKAMEYLSKEDYQSYMTQILICNIYTILYISILKDSENRDTRVLTNYIDSLEEDRFIYYIENEIDVYYILNN